MQAVAAEFNVSQTCFLTRIAESEEQPLDSLSGASDNPRFRLRWFTPVIEVNISHHSIYLCVCVSTN